MNSFSFLVPLLNRNQQASSQPISFKNLTTTLLLLGLLVFPTQLFAQSNASTAACQGEFVEQNGLVIIEVESATATDDWTLRTDLAGSTGTGYYEWRHGDPDEGVIGPGQGVMTYSIKITKTGMYRFLYRTAAPHSTEHNDAWIRFRDNNTEARTDGGDVIDLGQDNWIKVYQGKGQDSWNWAAHTEEGPHQVYPTFSTPGTYRLEISGRSTQFKMDRMSIFHFADVNWGTATNLNTGESECLLPVELTSFDGVVDGSDVNLRWETASETNNAGFDVEFSDSADGGFSKIGFVQGHGVTDATQRYQFNHDVSGFEGKTVYYRLKQVDFDGAFEYSDVVSITLPAASQTALYPAYPNPFNPTTNISFTLPVESEVTLSVFDLMGREVKSLFQGTLSAGYHTQVFEAADLANGTYIYKLETPTQTLTGNVLLLK